MSPPRPVSGAFDGVPYDEHQVRQLEMTVLTQLRDGMALTNSALAKLSDKVDETHSLVIKQGAANYDMQISKLDEDFKERLEVQRSENQRQVDTLNTRCNSHSDRLTNYGAQLARLGMGMAISAIIGTSALTAVVAIFASRLMGVH